MACDLPTMACLHCAYPLDGLSSHACPECGRAFDARDPRTFRRVLQHPADIASGQLCEVTPLRDLLESEDVPAVMEWITGTSVFAVGDVWVVAVNEGDAERARQIIADHRAAIAGLQPWNCIACGEQVDGGFDICWQCGADRQGNVSASFVPAVRPVQPHANCQTCGYPLRGLPRATCPECGTPFDPKHCDTAVEPQRVTSERVKRSRRRALVAWIVSWVALLLLAAVESTPMQGNVVSRYDAVETIKSALVTAIVGTAFFSPFVYLYWLLRRE